ncbi:MAG TPA: F0F1 ATP synthase subunit epsilon [Thermomicrobiales bacterium]|nr:F0F1 ATP synthase subunit epsilon [Thermomicrobiales bacterium]
MAKLSMELVTGERVVYQADDVDMVVAPGSEGTLGILPNHAALISLLSAGEVRVKKGNQEDSLIVFGGFVEVLDNRVIILADSAERAEEIDLERAVRARDAAEVSLRNESDRVSVAEADAALRRAALRLRIGERRRRNSSGAPR